MTVPSELPPGAIRTKDGGWIRPLTSERARDVGKRRNPWKPPPNPEVGYGAVWYTKTHNMLLGRLKDAGNADAVRLAEDQIVSYLILHLAQQLTIPADYVCAQCGSRPDPSARLMSIGARHLGRVHLRCMTVLLDDLERRAREIWVRLMTSPRRAPP